MRLLSLHPILRSTAVFLLLGEIDGSGCIDEMGCLSSSYVAFAREL